MQDHFPGEIDEEGMSFHIHGDKEPPTVRYGASLDVLAILEGQRGGRLFDQVEVGDAIAYGTDDRVPIGGEEDVPITEHLSTHTFESIG
jgi:hypothetical protein